MIQTFTIEQIISTVCDGTGVSEKQLRSGTRQRPVSDALSMVVWLHLRYCDDDSKAELMNTLNHHRTSYYANLKKFRLLYKSDPAFTTTFDHIILSLENLNPCSLKKNSDSVKLTLLHSNNGSNNTDAVQINHFAKRRKSSSPTAASGMINC